MQRLLYRMRLAPVKGQILKHHTYLIEAYAYVFKSHCYTTLKDQNNPA
jgi:hypothetical protein